MWKITFEHFVSLSTASYGLAFHPRLSMLFIVDHLMIFVRELFWQEPIRSSFSFSFSGWYSSNTFLSQGCTQVNTLGLISGGFNSHSRYLNYGGELWFTLEKREENSVGFSDRNGHRTWDHTRLWWPRSTVWQRREQNSLVDKWNNRCV